MPIKDFITKSNIKDVAIKNKYQLSIFIIGIVYIILAILYFKMNPFKLATNYKVISIFTTLFGLSILFIVMYFVNQKEKAQGPQFIAEPSTSLSKLLSQFIFSIFMFGIAIGVIIGIIYLFKNVPLLASVILYSINILIIVGALAFLYKLTPSFKRPKNPWLQLFLDIILFLPCLLTDFIDYLKYEYSITTKPIIIIFLIEVILVALKFVIPKLLGYIIHHDGIVLLDGSSKLSEKNTLGNYETMHGNNISKGAPNYKYNYAISFWFYIDPQPNSTNPSYSKNTNILSYGDKPKISYNAKNNELIITCLNGKEEKVVYKQNNVPYQKWTNIIFNYQGGTLDIFMDDKLISSTPGIVPYMNYDNITTGEINGVYGLVSNVMYFKNALSRNKISWTYNSSYKL